jgi:prepilin-type N-terminal cleavage/methylation domain-containing protein
MHRGYTLIEVAFVLAILGIIAGLGWANMKNVFPRFQTSQAAKSLKSDLMTLRKMAVESNRETRLRFVSHGGSCSATSSGGGSWEMSIGDKSIGSTFWDLLPEDTVEDNTDDDQALALRVINKNSNSSTKNVCLEKWGTIQGPTINSANNQDAIVFSPRGWLRNPSGDFSQNGFIEIVIHNLEALRGQLEHKVTVQIASSGMVRIYLYETDYNQNQVGVSTSSSAQ